MAFPILPKHRRVDGPGLQNFLEELHPEVINPNLGDIVHFVLSLFGWGILSPLYCHLVVGYTVPSVLSLGGG